MELENENIKESFEPIEHNKLRGFTSKMNNNRIEIIKSRIKDITSEDVFNNTRIIIIDNSNFFFSINLINKYINERKLHYVHSSERYIDDELKLRLVELNMVYIESFSNNNSSNVNNSYQYYKFYFPFMISNILNPFSMNCITFEKNTLIENFKDLMFFFNSGHLYFHNINDTNVKFAFEKYFKYGKNSDQDFPFYIHKCFDGIFNVLSRMKESNYEFLTTNNNEMILINEKNEEFYNKSTTPDNYIIVRYNMYDFMYLYEKKQYKTRFYFDKRDLNYSILEIKTSSSEHDENYVCFLIEKIEEIYKIIFDNNFDSVKNKKLKSIKIPFSSHSQTIIINKIITFLNGKDFFKDLMMFTVEKEILDEENSKNLIISLSYNSENFDNSIVKKLKTNINGCKILLEQILNKNCNAKAIKNEYECDLINKIFFDGKDQIIEEKSRNINSLLTFLEDLLPFAEVTIKLHKKELFFMFEKFNYKEMKPEDYEKEYIAKKLDEEVSKNIKKWLFEVNHYTDNFYNRFNYSEINNREDESNLTNEILKNLKEKRQIIIEDENLKEFVYLYNDLDSIYYENLKNNVISSNMSLKNIKEKFENFFDNIHNNKRQIRSYKDIKTSDEYKLLKFSIEINSYYFLRSYIKSINKFVTMDIKNKKNEGNNDINSNNIHLHQYNYELDKKYKLSIIINEKDFGKFIKSYEESIDKIDDLEDKNKNAYVKFSQFALSKRIVKNDLLLDLDECNLNSNNNNHYINKVINISSNTNIFNKIEISIVVINFACLESVSIFNEFLKTASNFISFYNLSD